MQLSTRIWNIKIGRQLRCKLAGKVLDLKWEAAKVVFGWICAAQARQAKRVRALPPTVERLPSWRMRLTGRWIALLRWLHWHLDDMPF